MSLKTALITTEILIGFALLLQSLEHVFQERRSRVLYVARALAGLGLILFGGAFFSGFLLATGYLLWRRFGGPYNGGSDRMGLLVLLTTFIADLAPPPVAEIAFGYLAAQVILSYVVAGLVKIRDPEWRDGRAMMKVFRQSIYPVSLSLRDWAKHGSLLRFVGWATIGAEILFPLVLYRTSWTLIGLGVMFGFHISNALLLGLNRFVWVWLSAYPAILWFQTRIAG